VALDEFLYRGPEAAGKRGEDGFVDDPFLGGVVGIIINCDQVIEGFDQFGFGLGGGLPPLPPCQWNRESLSLAAPRDDRSVLGQRAQVAELFA